MFEDTKHLYFHQKKVQFKILATTEIGIHILRLS